MPRRKPSTETKLKKGRGQGHGKDYKPYLTVREVPSKGKCSRPKGWKTGRVYQLLSTHELNYFYLLEWALNVADIREQYALLPLDETVEIAERLGIKHPTVPVTGELVVMTTDFMITERTGGKEVLKARAVKPESDLRNKRVVEKLEIERTYWLERGVDWGLVTDEDIPRTMARNIEWVHDALFPEVDPSILHQMETALYERVLDQQSVGLSSIALEVDRVLGQEPGTSLSVVRHLIATRKWEVDMYAPILPGKPLIVSRSSDYSAEKER